MSPSPGADLVSWLRVQLDEDERAISQHPDGEDVFMAGDLEAAVEQNYPCSPYLQISKARALREVEAKRRLLAEYEAEVQRGPARPAGHVAESEARHGGILDAYKAAIRIAALPFSDRPGYREEWRP